MKKSILYLCILGLFAACAPKSKSKEELKQAFRQLSEKMASDTLQARTFVKDAELYIRTHGNDTSNVHFIRLIAETHTMLGDAPAALSAWERLGKEYPAHSLAAEALFKRAFVLSEMMNRKEDSRPLYEEFVIRYPQHNLAEAARFQIQTLDKSQAELMLMLMQKSDTTAVSAEK